MAVALFAHAGAPFPPLQSILWEPSPGAVSSTNSTQCLEIIHMAVDSAAECSTNHGLSACAYPHGLDQRLLDPVHVDTP